MKPHGKRLDTREPLTDVPVLSGHVLIGELPSRAEVYVEIFAASQEGDAAEPTPELSFTEPSM